MYDRLFKKVIYDTSEKNNAYATHHVYLCLKCQKAAIVFFFFWLLEISVTSEHDVHEFV